MLRIFKNDVFYNDYHYCYYLSFTCVVLSVEAAENGRSKEGKEATKTKTGYLLS